MNYGNLLANLRALPEAERVATILRMPDVVFSDEFSTFVINCIKTGEEQLATHGGIARFFNKVNRYLPGVGWLGMAYFVKMHQANAAVLQTMAEIQEARQIAVRQQQQFAQSRQKQQKVERPRTSSGQSTFSRVASVPSARPTGNYSIEDNQRQADVALQDEHLSDNIKHGEHLHDIRLEHIDYTEQQDNFVIEHNEIEHNEYVRNHDDY